MLSTLLVEEAQGRSVLELPLPDFSVATAGFAVEYLEHHAVEPVAELDPPLRQSLDALISSWDRSFLASVTQKGAAQLPLLLTLAAYLDLVPLRNLCAASLAAAIQIEPDVAAVFGTSAPTAAETEAACAEFPWLAE